MSKPTTRAVPEVGGSNVVSILIVVLLPAPFEPRSPRDTPRSMVRSSRSTARTSPKLRESAIVSTAAWPPSPRESPLSTTVWLPAACVRVASAPAPCSSPRSFDAKGQRRRADSAPLRRSSAVTAGASASRDDDEPAPVGVGVPVPEGQRRGRARAKERFEVLDVPPAVRAVLVRPSVAAVRVLNEACGAREPRGIPSSRRSSTPFARGGAAVASRIRPSRGDGSRPWS